MLSFGIKLRGERLVFYQSVLGGVLGGMGLANMGVIYMPLALSLLWSISRKPLAASLWGTIAILISHQWLLSLHPLSFVGITSGSSVVITILLWLLCGFWGGILCGSWAFLGKIPIIHEARYGSLTRKICYALILSSFWGLSEVLLSKTPLFWVGIENSLLPGDIWLAGLARWIGSGGLAFIQLLSGWWLWQLGIAFKRRKSWRSIFIIGIALCLCSHFIGWKLISKNSYKSSIPIAIWQSDIPVREKFSKDNLNKLPYKLEEALEKAKKLGATFMVAPEGTIPLGQNLLSDAPIPLLSGGFRLEQGLQRSSLLVFNQSQKSFSVFLDKHRLVPLGEWVPNISLIPFSGLSAVGGIQPGEPSRFLDWNGPSISTAICYELTDGNALSKATTKGGEWILALANLDPYPILLQKQFLALGQLRSIENDRTLISVANTGPSAQINNSGEIKQIIPSFVEGVELTELYLNDETTGYLLWGNGLLVGVLMIGLFGLLIRDKN